MGWDAQLAADVGAVTEDGEARLTRLDVEYYGAERYGWSMTWNVSPMYTAAFGHRIGDLDGLPAPEAADKMQAALDAMEAAPETYRAMNPPNGWGSYESACRVLRQMIPVCREHPRATFQIC